MTFTLPGLPYASDALEPIISKKTIEFHYGKHHQAYVNNLNNLVSGTKFENMMLDQIILESDGGIFNNAAQIWNHTFYWEGFSASRGSQPTGELLIAIQRDFGGFDEFREKFSKAAATLFGSGWAWLVEKEDGSLEITQESNAGNPIKKGLKPLLTCDVWEHAYYIDYQNRRPDYIKDFWNLIDWDVVATRR